MHLVEGNGQIAIIEDWLVIAGSQTMYNLTLQQDHTYTVGDGQFVVHNCDRAELRANTNAGAGQQAHHIIPCQCEDDPMVKSAIQQGFQFDGAGNGMALDTDSNVASARGTAYHSGPHPKYTAYIRQQLATYGSQVGTANVPTALDGVQQTITDGRNYIASLIPGTRLD